MRLAPASLLEIAVKGIFVPLPLLPLHHLMRLPEVGNVPVDNFAQKDHLLLLRALVGSIVMVTGCLNQQINVMLDFIVPMEV